MNRSWHRAGAAAALGAVFALHAGASTPPLPPLHQRGDAAYVSGGVGDDESRQFKAAFGQFPLVVEVFRHAGGRDEYTADAWVRIVDRQGRVVLDEHADGPFMLVRLPAGEYRVSASLQGRQLAERQVKVGAPGHTKAVFVFG